MEEELRLTEKEVPLVYYSGEERTVVGYATVIGEVFTGKLTPEYGGIGIIKAIQRGTLYGLSISADEYPLETIKISGSIPGLFGIPVQIPTK